MTSPTVDILMATYNGERYIVEQIESIRSQVYRDWRLLVSDDCSTDGTLDIVRSYAAEDSRINIASEGVRYGSAKENFFSLVRHSKASYFMFCDQDDVWLPDKIQTTFERMHMLEQAEGACAPLMCFSDMKVVDADLITVSQSFERSSNIDPSRTNFPQLLAQSVGAGCTMMANRAAAELILRVREVDDVIMHDWWLSLVCSAFGKISHIEQPTSLYRQHGRNTVGAVDYNPLKRALCLGKMRKSVRASIAQAAAFSKVYGPTLSTAQKWAISEFIAAGNSSGVIGIFHLCASGCWKKGLRKVGQLMVAAMR